jgi:DNA-binding transcriptional ArsR family regulator
LTGGALRRIQPIGYQLNGKISMATDPLSSTFFALADATRRGILARLASGEATVGELAAPYDMSLAAVSKHLKVLEGAGLIQRSRDAQRRPCRLQAEPLHAVAEWALGYERFWSRNLDSLDAYLGAIQRKPARSKKKPRRKSR